MSKKYFYPHQVIQDLEKHNKKKDKEYILEQAWNDELLTLFEGLNLCYDYLRTFYLKKVPYIHDEDNDNESIYDFNDFKELLHNLETRSVSGNVAKNLLHDAALIANPNEWNYFYRRIILKDMKCGITEKTINKVLTKIEKYDSKAKDYKVDVFELQLASQTKEIKDLKGEKLIDTKYDGIRIAAFLDSEKNKVFLLSRNGKDYSNTFNIITQSLHSLLYYIPGSILLDGEIVSSSFQETLQTINSNNNTSCFNDSVFYVFDILPLNEFRKNICEKTQEERHDVLTSFDGLFKEFCFYENDYYFIRTVEIVPKLEVNLDNNDGIKKLNEFNAEMLRLKNDGFDHIEGTMIKEKYSYYRKGRNNAWVKLKPNLEVTLQITDVVEGLGKNKNKLGSLICEGNDLEHFLRVSVGTGFSDEQRKNFWNNKNNLIGQFIDIQADSISFNKNKNCYSLRFPKFVRINNTKNSPKET